DRALFLIQDFIIDYEMQGLKGYIYNRLPNLDRISSAVTAMHRYGLFELAALLREAAELFRNYSDPDPPTTWTEVLQQYDPTRRLDQLHTEIALLPKYGMDKASVQ